VFLTGSKSSLEENKKSMTATQNDKNTIWRIDVIIGKE
jgi:hypothetical protein